MRQSKLLLLFVVLMSMASNKSFAYDIEVNGIYYNALSMSTLEITKGDKKYEGDINVPNSIMYNGKSYDVVAVSDEAFMECEKLISITLGSNIRTIGDRAFQGCSSLKQLPSCYNCKLGKYAFAYCTSITSVQVSGTIREGLFYKCTSLEYVSLSSYIIEKYAFYGCTSLKGEFNLNGIWEIRESAFENCTGLTSVSINSSIVYSKAFSGCTGLTSVVIYSQTVQSGAFSGCTGITTVTLGGKTKMEYNTFEGCSSVKSITIEGDKNNKFVVSGIGAGFSNCNNIEKIELVNCNNAVLEDGALYSTDGWERTLRYVMPNHPEIYVLPVDVKVIDFYAFTAPLKRIVLGGSNVNIHHAAFYNCPELEELYIYNRKPDDIMFGTLNFDNFDVYNLDFFTENQYKTLDVYVPAGCSSYFKSNFFWSRFSTIKEFDTMNFDPYSYIFDVDGIQYKILSNAECEVVPKDDYSGDIVIPETVTINNKEYKVTSIGDNAFIYTSIISVIIPNSVKKIGKNAFSWCSKLTSVNLGGGVKEIDDYAFYQDSNITTLKMGNNVESIGESAFKACSKMTLHENFPKLISIANSAFQGCKSLTICPIGDKVISIGGYAFADCSGLTKVIIPNSVTTIIDSAFENCNGIKELYIGSGVNYIGYHAFYHVRNVESVIVDKGNKTYDSRDNSNAIISTDNNEILFGCNNTIIPNSITTIGKQAFMWLKMKSINIPNSVTTIKESAFYGCDSLASIDIPNSITNMEIYAFDQCKNLSSVSLSENLTTIDHYTFRFCNLTSITIPDKIKKIKVGAFTGTVLESIIIGSDIEEIHEYAFGSKSIKEVYCKAINVPKTSKGAFLYDDQGCVIGNATLHVPAESIEKYKASSPWNKFKEIVALKDDDTGIKSIRVTNDVKVIYSLNGEKLQTPSKGINIIKTKDGTVKKVLVR